MEQANSNWKIDVKRSKPILEALNEDGSISMEFLKGIGRGCLEGLKERHDQKKCE